MSTVAIIGGSGTEDLRPFSGWERVLTETRYGAIEVLRGEVDSVPALFCARHGKDHGVPPHLVNYKAIVSGLRELGAERVIGTAAVGSLSEDLRPGTAAVVTDFIDFTRRGPTTFYDGRDVGVVHTDFSEPYCPQISDALLGAAEKAGLEVTTPCTYICVDGPRYETPAEISTYRGWGADVVGMTCVPEAILCREAGICYGAIAIVTNYACGIAPSRLSHEEVLGAMRTAENKLIDTLLGAISRIPRNRDCGCVG